MNSYDIITDRLSTLGSWDLTVNSTNCDCSMHGDRNYRYRTVLHRRILIISMLSDGNISAALKRGHQNMVID